MSKITKKEVPFGLMVYTFGEIHAITQQLYARRAPLTTSHWPPVTGNGKQSRLPAHCANLSYELRAKLLS